MGANDNIWRRSGGFEGCLGDETLFLKPSYENFTLPAGMDLPAEGEEAIKSATNCRNEIFTLLNLIDLPFEPEKITSESTLRMSFRGEKIRAFAVTTPHEDHVFIDWVYVFESFREQGLARGLWDVIREESKGSVLRGYIFDESGRIERMVGHDGAVAENGSNWILTPSE